MRKGTLPAFWLLVLGTLALDAGLVLLARAAWRGYGADGLPAATVGAGLALLVVVFLVNILAEQAADRKRPYVWNPGDVATRRHLLGRRPGRLRSPLK
jgi:hypothetical protein